jgi:transposase
LFQHHQHLTAFSKSKVEVAVQVATRWVTAKLRNRRFFSLAELNAAIRELVTQLNDRVTRHLGASRRALFDEIERPALKALPVEPYLYAEWKEYRVGLDYHVEVERHYYSVPHALLREMVWPREDLGVFDRHFVLNDVRCGERVSTGAGASSTGSPRSGAPVAGLVPIRSEEQMRTPWRD